MTTKFSSSSSSSSMFLLSLNNFYSTSPLRLFLLVFYLLLFSFSLTVSCHSYNVDSIITPLTPPTIHHSILHSLLQTSFLQQPQPQIQQSSLISYQQQQSLPNLLHQDNQQNLSNPVLRTVFSPWTNPPFGWTRHNDNFLNATNLIEIWTMTTPPEYRFAYVATTFKYEIFLSSNVTSKGPHVIRLGLQDPTDPSLCGEGLRVFRIRVNSVYTKYLDPAKLSGGCRKPFTVDLNIQIYQALRITITMFKLPNFRPPSLSNFQLFKVSNSLSPSPSPSPVPQSPATPGHQGDHIPPPTHSPIPSGLPTKIFYDAGAVGTVIPTGAKVISHDVSKIDTHTLSSILNDDVTANTFATSLQGEAFTLEFPLLPGTYHISLGFVETSACDPTLSMPESPDMPVEDDLSRVFNVFFNGRIRLEAYNIYESANGCNKARQEVFARHIVDALGGWTPLKISFRAVANVAAVSYVRITPALNPCTPVTDNANILDDHLAHAVPGRYPPSGESSYVDIAGKGFVDVTLDGTGSHTHFSYPGGVGKITSYEWTDVETGMLLSDRPVFRHRFGLGTTRLRLSVTDNACTKDEAITTVTVTGSMKKGQYCYYYSWMSSLPAVNTLDRWPRPIFAASARATKLKFPYFSFKNTKFVVRCHFFVHFDADSQGKNAVFSIHTGGTGIARVYRGEDLMIDSDTSADSGPVEIAPGLAAFEVLYQRKDLLREPKLIFKVDGQVPKAVSYDQATVMPIITSVFPRSGTVSGGARVKVNGYGLSDSVRVFFGSVSRKVHGSSASTTQVFVISPPAAVGREKDVPVYVQSASGVRSNRLTYEYTDACDNIMFTKRTLRMPPDEDTGKRDTVPLDKPTSIVTWTDGSLFIGQRDGRVRVVSYDAPSLTVKSICGSKPLTDDRYIDIYGNPSPRSILGITFDPRDTDIARPYVSVSTLFWRAQKWVDEKNSKAPAWSNGAVVRLKAIPTITVTPTPPPPPPPSPDLDDDEENGMENDDGTLRDTQDLLICLEYDRTVVRNLPVADGDHAVNDLVFADNGDLLVSIGGATNAGLPRGKLGGKFDAFFSGSIIVAKLSLGWDKFNGDIPYTTPENYLTAAPISGYNDVDFYATGLRNPFSLIMARDGSIYSVDMGPNCGFGNASSSCDQLDVSKYPGRHWINFFPGQVITDRGPNAVNCSYGPARDDKVLKIEQDGFYGHPNLVRGNILKESEQCAWVDPLKGKAPGQKTAPSNYIGPIAMIRSAKTGVVQYGGNHFCGKLRFDLMFSANTENGFWRLRMTRDGEIDGSPFAFQPKGGIRVTENVHGDLIFPLYNGKSGVYVARPKSSMKRKFNVINALPFRHGLNGGSEITIGGWGFDNNLDDETGLPITTTVSIGQQQCVIKRLEDTEIRCTMPPHDGGVGRTRNVTVSIGEESVLLIASVLYMQV